MRRALATRHGPGPDLRHLRPARGGRLPASLMLAGLLLLGLLVAAARPQGGASGLAWAGEPAQPRQELLAAVPVNMAPVYSATAEGTPTGFAVELLRQVAARAGYSLRVITADSLEEAQQMLADGRVQVVPGLGVSDRRAERFAFTRGFETQPVHIYFRAQGPPREDLGSLNGLRVALVPGSIPMERLGQGQHFTVLASPTLPQALFDLFTGDADAVVFQAPRVEHAARNAGLESKLGRSRQPLFEVTRALAVDPGRPDVLARLDAALEEYSETEEFRELYSAWHADPRPPLLPPAALWLMGTLVVVLGGCLLAWRTVSLLRMNRRLVAALSERDQAMAAQRLTQDRMEALFTLTHMGGADTRGLITFALEEGVRLTESEMGFLLFLEGEEIDLSRIHWSRGAHRPPPGAQEQVYPLCQAGLWAECLRSLSPTVINDYESSPGRKGLPEGHAPITRFMTVPLVVGNRVEAVFGMANKDAPYDGNDTRQLQLFLVGLWRVLGARKDAESIRRAKDYAESLIEGANAMVVGLDKEGRITLFNASAEQITGFARAEVLGREWSATMLPGHLAGASAEGYREFMAGRTALPRQHVGVLRTKDGRERHVSWQNSLLTEDGEITGIIAFGIDITEQKQAEAELRRLHRAIEQAAEGVLITDETGAILYANPSLERMTGMERGGPISRGLSVFDLNLAVLEHHSSASHGEGNEGTWRGTCVFAKPGGAAAEVEFAVSAIRSDADRLVSYVAVCRDVTEKRLLEHQLWQAQKMEALGTLAGGVAHDFNNLLASIMGFTELAMDETPEPSRGRAYLARVLGACLRARELVRQILSFSRRSEHKLRHLRADKVVAEALKLLEASTPKNIELLSELAAEASILADPSQIHQIVMNLCTNAVQAMHGQAGRLTVRTSCGPLPPEVAARRRLPPGDYLTLTVQDQGPGIAPEVLGRIFDPFFTTKGPGEGTGLGLAVVHGIVASLGGAVWAESEPGQGARFFVLLPTQASGEEQPRQQQAGDLRGHERILLVDDEPDILELGRQTLTPLGYQVATQRDSEAALQSLQDAPDSFDLVLTDMNMPRLSGLQLIEGLRPLRPDLPCVLITGFSRAVPLDRLESLGAVRLLPKPFSTGELAQAVRQALAPPRGGGV